MKCQEQRRSISAAEDITPGESHRPRNTRGANGWRNVNIAVSGPQSHLWNERLNQNTFHQRSTNKHPLANPEKSFGFCQQPLFLGIEVSHCLTIFLYMYVIPLPGVLNFIYMDFFSPLMHVMEWGWIAPLFAFLWGTIKEQGSSVIKYFIWELRNFELSTVHFSRSIPYLIRGSLPVLQWANILYEKHYID